MFSRWLLRRCNCVLAGVVVGWELCPEQWELLFRQSGFGFQTECESILMPRLVMPWALPWCFTSKCVG